MTLNEVHVFLRFAVEGDGAAAALRYGDLFLTSEMLCCFRVVMLTSQQEGFVFITKYLRLTYCEYSRF